jgi:DNA polymerase sigma
VRPLAFILKKWSKVSQVFNPSGGLTSYCIYLLLIFFLQTRPEPVLPNLQQGGQHAVIVYGYDCYFDTQCKWRSTNTESVGQLLCKFFLFWWKFDWAHQAVSIRLSKAVPRIECAFPPTPMCVEDPFETGTFEL